MDVDINHFLGSLQLEQLQEIFVREQVKVKRILCSVLDVYKCENVRFL